MKIHIDIDIFESRDKVLTDMFEVQADFRTPDGNVWRCCRVGIPATAHLDAADVVVTAVQKMRELGMLPKECG